MIHSKSLHLLGLINHSKKYEIIITMIHYAPPRNVLNKTVLLEKGYDTLL